MLNHGGITNTESAQNHFAVLEQLIKRGRKFGVEISTEELKRDTIATLMSGRNQKFPMPIITIATNHRVVSTSPFEQMVLEFSQVSIQKVNDTDSELQSVTATKALQATNQATTRKLRSLERDRRTIYTRQSSQRSQVVHGSIHQKLKQNQLLQEKKNF